MRFTLVLLLFILTYNGLAQMVWHEWTIEQLSELNSNIVNSLADDEDGVWIGTEGGLMYYRLATKSFERITEFDNVAIHKVLYDEGWVFVLTSSGRVYRMQYDLETAALSQLTPEGTQVNDMCVEDGKIAVATSYSGVMVFENSLIEHFKRDSSFVGGDILRSIAWYKGEIYLGTNYDLRNQSGDVFSDSNGFSGKQVYKLGVFRGKLYAATDIGILSYNPNSGFKSVAIYLPQYGVVRDFSFSYGNERIATSDGLFEPDDAFWENDVWNRVDAGSNYETMASLIKNDLTFYAIKNEGLFIQREQDTMRFSESVLIDKIDEIFSWNGNASGVANSQWIFTYDTTWQRLKLVKDFGETIFGTLVSDEKPKDLYVFCDQRCFDFKTYGWIDFEMQYPYHLNRDMTPVYHPSSGVPSVVFHNKFIYSLIDDRFSQIVSASILPPCNHWQVRQQDAGVVFSCEDEVMVWVGGGNKTEPIFTITPKRFAPYTYFNSFFNDEYPLYINNDSMTYVYEGVQSIKASQDAFMKPGWVHFISDDRAVMFGDSTDNLNIYRLTDFRRVANFSIPFIPKHDKLTFLDVEETLWITDGSRIYFSEVPETPRNANDKPLLVFPNPTFGEFRVEISLEDATEAELSIVDSKGTVVDSRQIVIDKPLETEYYNLPKLGNGVYIVNLTSGNRNAQARIVILNH